MKIVLIAVALILSSFQAEALPRGAPISACSTLVPIHAPNQAGSDPFPYEVDLSALALSSSAFGYEGGKSYRIHLRGTSRNRNFRGFLIQARTAGDGSAVGSFDSGTQHQQVCTNETAATHVNSRQKTNVSVHWTAPPAGTGPINFWFSFVDVHRGDRSRFWARQMSDVVNEGVCPVKGQVQTNCTTCNATCVSRFSIRFCIPYCHNDSRCECPEGTVIDEDRNECVSPDECPEIPCPAEGQSFSSNCRQRNATCSNPSVIPICDFPMCACPPGQVVNEETNKCVNVSECTCPIKGQIRRECASYTGCHQTCSTNGSIDCPRFCVFNGCECPDGTVIDEVINECVAPSECSVCPVKGQVQVNCAQDPTCALTCINRLFLVDCPLLCNFDRLTCECPAGTVIDEERNECVSPDECPQITCPIKGQIFTPCFGANATCSDPNPPATCDLPQCVCPAGQIIDTVTTTCINGTECRRGCDIRRIRGSANYDSNMGTLTLTFSSNRQAQSAFFKCQIDDEDSPSSCTSPMTWTNLDLEQGRHSVTVTGNCVYNRGVTSTVSRSFSFRVRN